MTSNITWHEQEKPIQHGGKRIKTYGLKKSKATRFLIPTTYSSFQGQLRNHNTTTSPQPAVIPAPIEGTQHLASRGIEASAIDRAAATITISAANAYKWVTREFTADLPQIYTATRYSTPNKRTTLTTSLFPLIIIRILLTVLKLINKAHRLTLFMGYCHVNISYKFSSWLN